MRTWLLAEPAGPDGRESSATQGAPSRFHAAYGAWHASFGRYADLYARGYAAVAAIRKFASRLPELSATLADGVSDEVLDSLEAKLQQPLCRPLRLVWRLIGGQVLPGPRSSRSSSAWFGLFGAISVYDHATSMWMLSPERVPIITKIIRNGPLRLAGQMQMAVTSRPWVSFTESMGGHTLLVDAETGDVMIVSISAELLNAAPPEPQGDGILRWLEQFAARCSSGDIAIELADPEDSSTLCICPFPRLPPLSSDCVTNGVRVQASAVMDPDLSMPGRGIAFVYRVRFSLLSEDEQLSRGSKVVRSVQLRNRHWVITDGNGQTAEVSGDAVVGHHPLLTAGGPEFLYQSMTYHQGPEEGSMRGDFGFVEGCLQQPLSALFLAECAPFPLRKPAYCM